MQEKFIVKSIEITVLKMLKKIWRSESERRSDFSIVQFGSEMKILSSLIKFLKFGCKMKLSLI